LFNLIFYFVFIHLLTFADLSNIFELFLPVTQDIFDVFFYKKSSTLNRVTFYS